MKGSRERRFSLSSELQNVSVVRNKGEQVRLERKHRFLEKAMEKESAGLMNKKRELIDLKLLMQPTKQSDTRMQHENDGQCIASTTTLPKTKDSYCSNRDIRRRNRFVRSQSLSGLSKIPCIAETTRSHLKTRLCSHFNLSRSLGNTTGEKCKICATQRTDVKSDDERKVEKSNEVEKNISELLPPACLLPLYKQNSLKETRAKANAQQSISVKPPGTGIKKLPSTWHDLSNCRYLRMWTNHWHCYNQTDNKNSEDVSW